VITYSKCETKHFGDLTSPQVEWPATWQTAIWCVCKLSSYPPAFKVISRSKEVSCSSTIRQTNTNTAHKSLTILDLFTELQKTDAGPPVNQNSAKF